MSFLPLALSFSVMSPFRGCYMHVIGSEEFKRNSIYRLDSLEMRLPRHLERRADHFRSSSINGHSSHPAVCLKGAKDRHRSYMGVQIGEYVIKTVMQPVVTGSR